VAYRNGKKVPRRPYKKNFLYNEPNVTAKQLGKLIFSLKWDKNDIFVSTSPEDKIKCFNTDNFGFKWEIKGLGEYNIIADGFNDYAIFVVAILSLEDPMDTVCTRLTLTATRTNV
jgi:hypothetical protein